jgi:integral membrane protein
LLKFTCKIQKLPGLSIVKLTFDVKNIMSQNDTSVKIFRWVSILEAISFLLLLLIAMPLKYIWDLPEYVRIVGMAHGILFILYLIGGYWMFEKLNWSVKVLFIVFLSSILPFGPFVVERRYLP